MWSQVFVFCIRQRLSSKGTYAIVIFKALDARRCRITTIEKGKRKGITRHPLSEFLMCLGQQDGFLFINDTQHQRPAIFRLSALLSMICAAEVPIVSNSRWNEKGQEGRKSKQRGRSRISVVLHATSLSRWEVIAATAVFKVDLRGGLRTGKTEIPSTWLKRKGILQQARSRKSRREEALHNRFMKYL